MDAPQPYHVSYSGRVREELRDLIVRARVAGMGRQLLAAFRDLDHRLHVYPQFGEPLSDLSVKPAQLWIGVVAPLVVKYILDESRRQVMIVHPITPLPDCGL